MWHGPWLGIQPRTSCTQSQHSTYRGGRECPFKSTIVCIKRWDWKCGLYLIFSCILVQHKKRFSIWCQSQNCSIDNVNMKGLRVCCIELLPWKYNLCQQNVNFIFWMIFSSHCHISNVYFLYKVVEWFSIQRRDKKNVYTNIWENDSVRSKLASI